MYLFGNLIYISVLLINAIAILSEDRFLARINLSPSSYDPAFGQGADASAKAKIINLIASVRTLMRIPLIVINTLIIVYELVLG
ncbi:Yos1-like protein [Thozetella sp. PMI_491]|nr:Yos1-like protein [Thozetella sp. PMI_491]